MTREEIITNIQNKLNSAYMMKDREKVDEIIGIVFDEVEKLRQPVTLAEFLGWDENEIYTCFGDKYSIKNNELYVSRHTDKWSKDYMYNTLIDIKKQAKKFECKKIEPKKYYLQLKFKYNDFLCKHGNKTYINFNTEDEYFLDSKNNFDYCKTQFTDEEIKNIKLPEPLTLDMFDKIEVE